MTLCNDRHEEVCFEGKECPVCALEVEIVDLKEAVEDITSERDSLQNDLDDPTRS